MRLIESLKRGLSCLADKLIKNSNYVHTVIVILIINFFIWFNVGIKHSAELLKEQGEKAVLALELNQSRFLLKQTSEAFDFQWEIINKQRQQLEKAEEVIQNQGIILQDLIRYLKDTKQWPPKIKPVDPNSLAKSEAI